MTAGLRLSDGLGTAADRGTAFGEPAGRDDAGVPFADESVAPGCQRGAIPARAGGDVARTLRRMGAQRVGTTIGIGILVVMLSACTAPPGPLIDAARPSSAAPTPVASAPATVESSAPPVADLGPCGTVQPASPVGDPAEPEQLGGKTLPVVHDRGWFETAAGETAVDAAGTPVAYLVAPGDVFSTIAARFCMSEDTLQVLNHARRDNNGLYAGDTLNLDPHTIFSVGDQNGVVSDNTFPEWFTLPPQR